MTREGGVWQWRLLHGEGEDGYARGGWREMRGWLEQ